MARYDKPTPSLKTALGKHGSVGSSLIVLPEGFNINKYYRDPGPRNYDAKVLEELQSLAAKHDVTFVAGVIVEEPKGPIPPFNSVYLVHNSGSTLICQKRRPDNYSNYTPFKASPETANLVQYGGSTIAAIVCKDCDCPDAYEPIQNELDELAEAQGSKIVCIPACRSFSERIIASSWQNCYVILANSDPCGCISFVSKNGEIVPKNDRAVENSIGLTSLLTPSSFKQVTRQSSHFPNTKRIKWSST